MWPSQGQGKPKTDVALSWTLNLNGNGQDLLKKGQKVSKEVKVSIKKKNGGGDLWPLKGGNANEKLDITAEHRSEKVLIVKLTELPTDDGGNGIQISYGNGDNGELTCNEEDLVTSKGGTTKVYGETMKGTGTGKWKKSDDGSLKIDVSLRKCEVEGKEVKCDLNVVTEIS